MPGKPSSWVRPLVIALGITCVAAGLGLAAHIGWYLHNSSVHGAALVRGERQAIGRTERNALACQGSVADAGRVLASGPGSVDSPHGLLEIPALRLVAPVLQGTGEDVLSGAVGHVAGSVWPGHPGTTVLAAHDVTWFSRIDSLEAGDQIRYVTPCRTFAYRVTAHRVVRSGYAVYNTSAARIVLDTCYPLNALYVTHLRYLVYADLTEALPTTPFQVPSSGPAALTVRVPAARAATGLSLQQNGAPLGTLTVTGSPRPAWRQTNAPLQAEGAALTAYFGIIRTAEQGQRRWWAELAPSVPMSEAAAIRGGKIADYATRLHIALQVRDSQVLGAQLSARIGVAGSAQPGTYDLTVTEQVAGHGGLLVSGFALRTG